LRSNENRLTISLYSWRTVISNYRCSFLLFTLSGKHFFYPNYFATQTWSSDSKHPNQTMARYTGPKSKIARRFGEPILGNSKALSRKNYGPGQHGKGKRGKKSEYALQLQEKQKMKYTYGILERQFRTVFHRAAVKDGITGENLIKFCESRLDNTVYRLGIAPTRRAARQLVIHKHIVVDGEVVNVPSYSLKPGQQVGVREKSKSLEAISNSLNARVGRRFNWLEWDQSSMTGKFMAYPERDQIPENFNEQAIVELYSK
jgi:small subunit ribosomal protein S4